LFFAVRWLWLLAQTFPIPFLKEQHPITNELLFFVESVHALLHTGCESPGIHVAATHTILGRGIELVLHHVVEWCQLRRDLFTKVHNLDNRFTNEPDKAGPSSWKYGNERERRMHPGCIPGYRFQMILCTNFKSTVVA
jgi:hypothetical protein